MPLTERQARQVELLRARGLKYPRIAVQEAARVGLPLSYGLAFLEKESTGRDRDGAVRFGLNLFGHDAVRNPVKGGFVSQQRYGGYLAARRAGQGMQGVGPLQLTWWEFQDMADRIGGCWQPRYNMRVGFGIAKALIRQHGPVEGAARWNGTGTAAAAYAQDWLAKQRRWHQILNQGEPVGAPSGRALRLTSPYLQGPDVSALQQALNRRLADMSIPAIDADGEYGPETDHALRQATYLLGIGNQPVLGPVPAWIQQLIEHPEHRNPVQQQRGAKRLKRFRAGGGARSRTLRWCAAQVGTSESPPNSNRGPKVSKWEREFGMDGQPWCGAFVGYALRHLAGIPVPGGIVYTPNIANYARAHTGGFAGFYKWTERQPGDLVLFKFPGVSRDPVDHVGILDGDGQHTIEGNTSTGTGSQNNGGVVARRDRGGNDVVGCARPRYH